MAADADDARPGRAGGDPQPPPGTPRGWDDPRGPLAAVLAAVTGLGLLALAALLALAFGLGYWWGH